MDLPEQLVPQPGASSRDWWTAAAEGRLTVQRCTACGHLQLYPRAHCTTCWSADLELVEASGRGTVHSWTVTHRNPEPAFEPPYVYAVVELEEGPRLSALVKGAGERDMRVGRSLRVAFEPVVDGIALPLFELAPEQERR